MPLRSLQNRSHLAHPMYSSDGGFKTSVVPHSESFQILGTPLHSTAPSNSSLPECELWCGIWAAKSACEKILRRSDRICITLVKEEQTWPFLNHAFAWVTPAISSLSSLSGVWGVKPLFAAGECKLVNFAVFVKTAPFWQGTKTRFTKTRFSAGQRWGIGSVVYGMAKFQALIFTFQGLKFPVKSLVLLLRIRNPLTFQALKFQNSGPEIWRIHPPPFHTPPFARLGLCHLELDADFDAELGANFGTKCLNHVSWDFRHGKFYT